MLRERSEIREGVSTVPIRYDDRNQWHHFVPEPAHPYVHLWHTSHSSEDWENIERLGDLARSTGRLSDRDLGWAYFVQGRNPNFPLEALQADLQFVQRKLKRVLNERGDPETWFDAHWLSLEPMPTDNLVRLTIGGLPVHKRGEMLHSYLRYFDLDAGKPGLPQGVAALVTSIAPETVEVEIINTNLFESRSMVVQGGAYGEHVVTKVAYLAAGAFRGPGSAVPDAAQPSEQTVSVDGRYFRVDLEPGAGTSLKIGLRRFSSEPSYAFPWRVDR